MPCFTDPPSDRELQTKALEGFIRELKIPHLGENSYEALSVAVCDALKQMTPQQIREDCSLELQIWWRDHQRDDRAHQLEERERIETKRKIRQIRGKLTQAENIFLDQWLPRP